MANLKFTDTHNMVAFLSKPEESDGFKQIVDFLNAQPIRYDLTVNPTIYTSCIEQFWPTVKAKTINREVQLHTLVDGKKIIITESTVRRDLQLEDAEGIDCLSNSTIFEEPTRMGYEKNLQKLTFYKAFFSPQWKFLIHTILQCLSVKTTAWNEFSSTMASAIICLATNQKFNFSKYIFESMVRNLDNLSGKFLMYLRNMRRVGKGFSGRVTPLFPTMVVQNQAELSESSAMPTDPHHIPAIIESLSQPQKSQKPRKPKRKDTQIPQPSGPTDIVADEVVHKRVKKLEKKDRSRTHKMKRLYKVGLSNRVESSRDEESLGEDASKQGRRIKAIDADEDITLVNDQDDNKMFDVDALGVSTAATTAIITTEEITLAQALEVLKTSKPKVKGIVFQEPGKSTTTTTISSLQSQDKGKGIMVEEPVKTMKKKDLIRLDEEIASKLQAEFDEEERLAREKAKKEANVALIEEWDDIQAKIEADHELAQRLQAEEQEELSVEEKAKLFQQLLEQRRKHFAAKSVEDKRNKPPTQTQQRKIIAFKRVNTFVDFRTDLVEGSSKRAGEELEQESTKKQKVDEDKDTTELQSLMEVIPDEEEVAIDAIPLATKSPRIVDWKIYKEGKKSYYQIMRADGKSQMYRIFSHMLKSFSREDLEDLYKLTIFEPHVEDTVWRNQQDYKVLEWKLYDSCGVHSLRMQHVYIYMLVEKRYPLTPPTIIDMLNKKLQGRIVGIKSLLNAVSITAALIDVNAAQSKLVLLENFNENYSKCLRLLYKVNAAEGVNAASEEVSTAELVSTAYFKEFDLLKWDQQAAFGETTHPLQ
ncbi:hypothetical protein Tco_0509045 [Tanacetum coccineum]